MTSGAPRDWNTRRILGAGAVATAVGLMVLVGWVWKIPVLVQINPSYAPMKRNTAFGFVVCGVGFLLSSNGPLLRKLSQACGVVAAVLGFATLLEYLLPIDLHIDEALGPGWTMVRAPYAGRMSPLAALCFLLIGIAMVAAWGPRVSRSHCWVVALTGTLSSAIALASMFGYLIGASTMLGWVAVTWMAVHTAPCFLLLASSLIAQAWIADQSIQDAQPMMGQPGKLPAWAPLCTGIGASSVLLALIQSALSLDRPQYSGLQVAGFLASVILTLGFMVIVPMEFKHRITTGLWMALVVFLFTAYFSFRILALDGEGQARVMQTHDVLAMIDDATIRLRQAIAGYRGDNSTHTSSDPEPWRQNTDLAGRDFVQLRLLMSDNPEQQHALDQVDILFAKTVVGMKQRLLLQQQSGTTAGLEESRDSQIMANMKSVESLIVGIQEEERRLRQLRIAASADNLARTRLVVALADSLAILFLAAAGAIAGVEFGARQRSEHALTAAQEKLTLALAAGNMGTWEIDLRTNESWRSIEHDRIFGYDTPLPEWESKTFFGHIHPDDREQMKSGFERSLRDGKIFDEIRIIRADHVTRWISVQGSVLYDEHHVPVKMAGVVHDITASKEQESEIRQLNEDLETRVLQRTTELTEANQELEAFTYSAAHDLRAPLRHMNGFVGFLRQSWYEKLDPEGRRNLDKIATSSRNMGILLDDLLNFSRLGKVEMRRGQVSLRQIVDRIREELAPDLEGRDLTWEIGDLPNVSGDGTLLHQVMMNLIANAVKFTKKSHSARIQVGSRRDSEEFVTVFVTDNGTGFEMQYVHKLFGVFQRLHAGQEFEGTGIGLAIVRRIVERHGGRVWAEGIPDQGATFHFSLPMSGG